MDQIITLPLDVKITITFGCFTNEIPEDIKIKNSASGSNGATNEIFVDFLPSLSNTKIDFGSLLEVISVDTIAVVRDAVKNNNYCQVHINATTCDPEYEFKGLHVWGGEPYEKFIQKFLGTAYKRVTLKIRPSDNKIRLRLSEKPNTKKEISIVSFRL